MKLKILILLVITISALNAQWYNDNPFSAHYLTADEYLNSDLYSRNFYETDPPEGNPNNVAEFEHMQAVMVRYPFGITYALIAEMSQEITVITIVENQSQENTVLSSYNSNGVNTDNCEFLHAPSDSYWTRDYGPMFARHGNDEIGIVNFDYNRPRPNDNDIPIELAEYLGIELFGMNVIHTGGNYMTDGMGISASTTIVYTESASEGISQAQVDQRMFDYLGIEEYHVVEDPNNTYIDHIDCWGKFLDVDKILLRSVPESHAQYDEIEATADYFSQQTSSYGTPYEIYRVYTPNDQPYTNSLILNNRVFVPITGSQWDDEAITSYEEAMPGYEIFSFTGSWESTDALHCRTKGVADLEMVYIKHIPLAGFAPVNQEIMISAEIIPFSGSAFITGSPKIFYKINDGDYTSVPMTAGDEDTFSGTIPGQTGGTEIQYYIFAEDTSGKSANHPFIGEFDPHTTVCGGPSMDISQDYFEINVETGTEIEADFEISNTGTADLEYSISLSAGTREEFTYDIPNSPSANNYENNTFDENGWTEFDITDEGTISDWSIQYTWSTDNWAYEGSFHALSPSGTSLTIGSGNASGNHQMLSQEFNEEDLAGTWRIWIEDTYGDGGHQATNIVLNISTLSPEEAWLSVSPLSGIIATSNSETIDFSCNATQLPVGDYFGTIYVQSNDAANPTSDIEIVLHVLTDVEAENGVNAVSTKLIGNYPNPFNPSTTISYSLSSEDSKDANLQIFNVKGQIVKTFAIDQNSDTAENQVTWTGKDNAGHSVSSGIYFYKLEAGQYIETKKMVLMK
jgi:agmatine deiminase